MDEHTMRIPYPQLQTAIAAALTKAGLENERARQEAIIMIEADLHGTPSHGIRMLPGLLQGLADGRVKAKPKVTVLRDSGGTCVLNGDNGPGRTIAWQAMQLAMTKAENFGIGACLATKTTHWGRAHTYACRAAQAGYIGICTTNGMPCMAGWGATGRIIGNNPIAIGVPRQDAEKPVVLDMAMSRAAVGKVGTWQREGKTLPDDWGIDASGKPSRDPQAILAGAVLPFGGHKGAGLALMVELLTAALAGGAFGSEIEMGDRSGLDPESCKLFLALNPLAFSSKENLTARVEEYLAYLQQNASTRSPFLWPGERGWRERESNMAIGVPVHRDIISDLQRVGVVLMK
jgi:LDH2 family malate/lactate/ureidoglycolate dehydrogenase